MKVMKAVHTPERLRRAATRQREQATAGREFAEAVQSLDTDQTVGIMHYLRQAAMYHDQAARLLDAAAADREQRA
jgi:hypothetical protein